jgi:hypothetical protein
MMRTVSACRRRRRWWWWRWWRWWVVGWAVTVWRLHLLALPSPRLSELNLKGVALRSRLGQHRTHLVQRRLARAVSI